MIYSFVLDDSIYHDVRTTKCREPLQKIRVRLRACKTSLSTPPPPSKVVLLIVPRRYICCGIFFLCVFWSRIFVLFEPHVCFHIFS